MNWEEINDSKVHTVGYDIVPDGFVARIDSEEYHIGYPKEIWSKTPVGLKKAAIENYLVLTTYSMPLMSGKKTVNYEFGSPLLESFFIIPTVNFIPVAEDRIDQHSSIIKGLFSINRVYKKTERPEPPKITPGSSALCFMTFGKESLLNYALLEELGLDPVLLYIQEPDISYTPDDENIEYMYENMHKEDLIKSFKKEFDVPVHIIDNQLGRIRFPQLFNSEMGDLSWGTNLTEYSLLSLPFCHTFCSNYIVCGNEASCSDYYMDETGFASYPVFEQSRYWTLEMSKMVNILVGSLKVVSLLEPIHEIAIMRLLHTRYPQYAKYQMSCFAENHHAKHNRWCQHCSKCARMYAFLKALDIDPGIVGFDEDMFSKQKEKLYSLFGTDPSDLTVSPYDSFGTGRDEILFAFYLAYKNGAKGDLIDKFKNEHLAEAISREEELSEKFFGMHTFETIPKNLRGKVREIFEEELSKGL